MLVGKGLKESGFNVGHAQDGTTGLHMALNESYDGAIIDIMLPGIDGLSIIEILRSRKINLPVIILSAKRSVDDRIRGLQRGGDDYLVKPFAFTELLARVQALVRRANHTVEATGLEVHDLSIDLLARTVVRAGKKNLSAAKRILIAGIPHAQRRPHCFENNEYGTCVGL